MTGRQPTVASFGVLQLADWPPWLASVWPLVAARYVTALQRVSVMPGLRGWPVAYCSLLRRAATGRWLAWVASVLLE